MRLGPLPSIAKPSIEIVSLPACACSTLKDVHCAGSGVDVALGVRVATGETMTAGALVALALAVAVRVAVGEDAM